MSKSAPVAVIKPLSIEEQLASLELTSLGFVRIPDTETYVSYQITTKNGKVVSMTPVSHQGRQLAEEEVKIDFVKIFVWELEQ